MYVTSIMFMAMPRSRIIIIMPIMPSLNVTWWHSSLLVVNGASTPVRLEPLGKLSGEASYTSWPSHHPGQPMPKLLRSLQKLEKVEEP